MNSRRHSRSSLLVDYGATTGVKHPMLIHGAGITAVAAACTSAANALTLSVIMLLLCSGVAMVYIFERGEYVYPMLGVIYFTVSSFGACVCATAVNFLSPGTAASLGMYLPLTAADALVLARLQPDSPFVSPSDALPAAIRLWWLYAAMALPVGLLREILGKGTVFGMHLFFRLSVKGMNLPFAGFIMLGFALAIYNRMAQEK